MCIGKLFSSKYVNKGHSKWNKKKMHGNRVKKGNSTVGKQESHFPRLLVTFLSSAEMVLILSKLSSGPHSDKYHFFPTFLQYSVLPDVRDFIWAL